MNILLSFSTQNDMASISEPTTLRLEQTKEHKVSLYIMQIHIHFALSVHMLIAFVILPEVSCQFYPYQQKFS